MKKEKTIDKMTKTDFWNLPERKWNKDIGEFDCLVILPTRRKHDSGYRLMDFAAVRKNKAICRLSGCSDVIHIDGIGGYGKDWVKKYKKVPKSVPPIEWSIDCLMKSGFLRLFSNHCNLVCGLSLSSFEIFAIPIEEVINAK